MAYEIWFRSKLTVGATRAYADSVENARALVMHHLNAGRYDYAAVYGPEGGQAIFRANRWFSPYYSVVVDNPAPEPVLRVVPRGMNPYEFAARVGKARKLAETLLRHGITYRMALEMQPDHWRLAAVAAGVNQPSDVTAVMALEEMAAMSEVAA